MAVRPRAYFAHQTLTFGAYILCVMTHHHPFPRARTVHARSPTGYVPQVKAEVNANAALGALYGQPENPYLQDPSQFDLGPYAHAHLGAHLNGGGGGTASAAGPDRNRPRGRAVAKRTGACARCRRLKVRAALGTDAVCSRSC